jgi:hypothetical protein
VHHQFAAAGALQLVHRGAVPAPAARSKPVTAPGMGRQKGDVFWRIW